MQLLFDIEGVDLVRVVSQFNVRFDDLLLALFFFQVGVLGNLEVFHGDVSKSSLDGDLLVLVESNLSVLLLGRVVEESRLVLHQVAAHDVCWVACPGAD